LATGISARLSAPERESRDLRHFGLLVGGIFALIAAWPVVSRGEGPRFWAAIIAAGLILPGLVVPTALRPVYRHWMKLSHGLGWLNTRLLLGAAYLLLLTPIGVVMKLVGRDPLSRRLRDRDSYWVTRERSGQGKRRMELRF
jgi:hypothetical protein